MKHRILIVEDNILLAGQQKKWFEKSGYEAVTTIDEPGARRLLKRSLSILSFPMSVFRRGTAYRCSNGCRENG